MGLASGERQGVMMLISELPVEGHILTHTDGAAGVQLAPWGALASKGASVVPADTVHARVRGALIDICGKKGTVTGASATGRGFLGWRLGEVRGKEHKERSFSAVRIQPIGVLHVQLKYAPSQGGGHPQQTPRNYRAASGLREPMG